LSLVELLVVLVIVAVLLGILLPAVARIRGRARDVVCLARLRGLATAALNYRVEHRRFPESAPPPAAPAGSPLLGGLLPSLGGLLTSLFPPQQVDRGVLNQLAPFAGFRPLSAGLGAIDLPPEVQSPEVEAEADGRGPLALGGSSTYRTGFVYTAGLYDANGKPFAQLSILPLSPTSPVASRPAAPASAPAGPMVLWADTVYLAPGAGRPTWEYTHAKGGAQPGPQPLTYGSASGCRGQHRAYLDLSAEWVPAAALNLDPASPQAPGQLPVQIGTDYWWY
jgi:type II secretory pathway pseudopilin PulG